MLLVLFSVSVDCKHVGSYSNEHSFGAQRQMYGPASLFLLADAFPEDLSGRLILAIVVIVETSFKYETVKCASDPSLNSKIFPTRLLNGSNFITSSKDDGLGFCRRFNKDDIKFDSCDHLWFSLSDIALKHRNILYGHAWNDGVPRTLVLKNLLQLFQHQRTTDACPHSGTFYR